MRRVLIDECINPRLGPRLRTFLPDHVVETVRDLGWAGQQDHILILQLQGRFDAFLTIDKRFEYEHNVEKLAFGVVVLETANNQMPSYERLLEDLIGQIRTISAGQVVR
jgi:predicted nuclease of predicted toxin-antitoxin system